MLRASILRHYVNTRWPTIMSLLDKFAESQYLPPSDLAALQEEKLRSLIRFAYERVPYYRKQLDSRGLAPSDLRSLTDLRTLPLLSRRDLPSLVATLPTHMKSKAYVRHTSGSTGTPTKILVSNEATFVETALFYRFLHSLGYQFGDGIVKIWGAPLAHELGFGRRRRGLRQRLSSWIWNTREFDSYKIDPSMMGRILACLTEGDALIVRGYAAAVHSVALEILHRGINVGVKAVTTTAERLFAYQRQSVEHAFRCRVFDQYGCGESNSIAFECNQHIGLHIASEHVIVELLDDKGEPVNDGPGYITITDLDNYAMPLVRYQNGDLATWASGACPCGRTLPRLASIDGRVAEVLDLGGGRRIHAGFFDQVYAELGFGDKYVIRDVRIVRVTPSRYRLEFAMLGELSALDIAALNDLYREHLGDVSIEIAYLSEIPRPHDRKQVFLAQQTPDLR